MRLRLSRPLLGTTALLAVLTLPVCGASAAPSASQSAASATSAAASQLHKLADAFYRARAHFDPLLITANGDSRYDSELGMSISPTSRARQFALYRRMQGQLKAIPRARLSDAEQLNYDLLAFEIDSGLSLEKFPEHLLPLNHFENVPGTLANYASGTGSQPLHTVAQYQAYLSRLNQLPAWIDQAIANMREGVKRGIVQPKAITVAMLPQFQQLRSATPEANIFYTPIKNLPAAFSQADKERLTAAYRKTVAIRLSPALDRLALYLEKEYLPASRNTDGWSALPNGAAWYQAQIKDRTTVSMNPEEIHQLGLKEVARIEQQWALLGPKLGYSGPPAELPQWVEAQDKFKPFKTEAEVLDAYRQIDSKVRTKLPALFSLLPKAPLELQLEPELTRATASDHYTPAAADGSHPGVFWAVVNAPKQYSRTGMVTLYLHEGQPGHHFHAGLLKELDVPDFRKFNTENPNIGAFTEGWALYSETLGHEFGLYDDPEAYFGHLNDELLRAVRLVVDTGMHAKGWTREQAIAYASKTLGYSEARAKNQIERYMVWPAQALSYKIGALKILELRERARKAMGDKFSLPKFHEVVIGDGTLPLPLLEARVDRWIASAK
ncbi:DUF885 domain-containing protein [Massilia antarctica]|uniref:DUF885 domain-containing protein n=1 Tax=Massilia antarctica TaxID=2765360 RepID=UPI0006BB7650|nr:DUF885 domain-containing protein [Massilia sp. H27-R4]MCY0911551.1 DUF885 domain-containing protein [Massilia sp. H27-R4]CUI04833.1 protein of unknown function DUF885 [Janthinobacterium sp. CG23_2]CUU28619.1 protein of unknown function DUF885 [Janthinobacterium sp. CG23_2]